MKLPTHRNTEIEMSQPERSFKSTDGDCFLVSRCYLDYFDNSLLSMLARAADASQKKWYEPIQVDIPSSTLEKVLDFYHTGKWPDPHIITNKLELPNMPGASFEEICDYLGLPFEDCDIIFESDSDDAEDLIKYADAYCSDYEDCDADGYDSALERESTNLEEIDHIPF